MRIAYVTHCLQVGGAEILVVNYLLKLKELGHDVCLIQMWDRNTFLKKKLVDNNIKIYTLAINSSLNIFNKIANKILSICMKEYLEKKLNNILKKIKPDVVHVHTNVMLLDAIKFNNLFFTFHTDVDRTFSISRKEFKSSFENSINNGLKVIAISEKIKKQVLSLFPNATVYALGNGIDVSSIRSKKINREQFLMSIGIPDDAFILGHVGRLHPVKNHEKIISVFAEIVKKRPNSYLLLVGGSVNNRLKKLTKLGTDMHVIDKIRFLGERKDATEIMSVFDCFILPSHREGFSLVLCEAQAHNIRAIATAEVPDEAVINDNCFKLDIYESDKRWANYVLGSFTESHDKEMKSLDINFTIKKHLDLYEKGLNK